MGGRGPGGVPGDLVRSEDLLAPLEGLLRELLHVGLAGGVVGDGVILGVLGFELCSAVSVPQTRNPLKARGGRAYLLQPVHQGGGVGEALLVGVVELLREDLVDGVILTFGAGRRQ